MSERRVTLSGSTVRQLRLAKGWSVPDLARAAGCDRRTIEKIESNAAVRTTTLRAVAVALGVAPRQLLPEGSASALAGDDLVAGTVVSVGGSGEPGQRDLVEFIEPAAGTLPVDLQRTLRPELKAVFTADPQRPGLAVTVFRCFTGYSQRLREVVVLGVGVRFEDAFETHVIKIGARHLVERDWIGWRTCTEGRDVASRIFHPVRSYALPGDRYAVLYRDAYTLFGGHGPEVTVKLLEEVVDWAVNDDKPDPVSVERALAQIFTDLGRWFYHDAEEDPARARAFYDDKLGARQDHQAVLDAWGAPAAGHGLNRLELRRDAIWLLCAAEWAEKLCDLDAPYLDPVDYVRWAIRQSDRLPPTLVGRAHGDLHARNVLLGVRRGEAEYPAVFDYGAMGRNNVLAWDFAKLETELKVRQLPKLYRDAQVRAGLVKDSRRKRPPGLGEADGASEMARRADTLRFAYEFERLLADRTERILGRSDAEALAPPGGRQITGVRKLDRLLGLVLRVRQEAALALGYDRRRQYDWREEYYFALAVYGLINTRFEYEPREVACALISAGVAAARMAQARRAVRTSMDDEAAEDYPSYRAPVYLAHRYWQQGKPGAGLKFLDRHREGFAHAVPVLQEHALLLVADDPRRYREAESIVKNLQDGCVQFGDHETLSRLGGSYKALGDHAWNESWNSRPRPEGEEAGEVRPAGRPKNDSTAWRHYRMAQEVYQQAFDLGDNHYPGINAATLALLIGDAPPSRRLAQKVASICLQMKEIKEEDRFYVPATRGEAALLLGMYEDAMENYKEAMAELDETHSRPLKAAYDQLCRLWHVLDPDKIGEIVERAFAKHQAWAGLQKDTLGSCGGRK